MRLVLAQWDDATVRRLIRECQTEAGKATATGNPPFGAVITDETGRVVARDHNTQRSTLDPTAHAEINVIRQLCAERGVLQLEGHVMVSNAASCPMCSSAAIQARIQTFYYGAPPESWMTPWLTLEEVAARARHPTEVFGPILKDECTEQIARGREATQ